MNKFLKYAAYIGVGGALIGATFYIAESIVQAVKVSQVRNQEEE